MMNDKDIWYFIKTAICATLNKLSSNSPLSIRFHSRFTFSHKKAATNFVTNRICIDSSGRRTEKGFATDNTSLFYRAFSFQGGIIARARAILGRCGSKIYYLKRFATDGTF
jgi:hypothetical protein